MDGALKGIRVVDMTTVIMGPWAAQMLGDAGAEVIKVETPAGDLIRHMGPKRNDGMAAVFLSTNRNKRSIVLDLTQDAGRKCLQKIVGTADVFMHNSRPQVMNKLGFDYESFKGANPDLVYCGAYGFRSGGPLADKPAYDDVIQAASGIADLLTQTAGSPRYAPTIVADKTAAYGVYSSIVTALLHRERNGGGQAIEMPMFETMVDYVMVEHLYGAVFEPPIDDMGYARILNPGRRPYATKDGFLTVLPYSDKNWRDFFILGGRHELVEDPRFSSIAARVENSEVAYEIVAEIIATRTTAQWQQGLDAADIPVMAVNSLQDLIQDEQLAATGFWRIEDHPTEGKLRMIDPPVRYSESPSSIRRMAPRLGEHSAEILAETGHSETEITELFAAGVSAPASERVS
jgi:crotonobetainyl-CoA:carnitine CoA-transferase CaiB-like acyl-CoA transferase